MPRPLTEARWTHVALPVGDLERSIEFYTSLTPLVVVFRNEDESGKGAWLSNERQVENPFVLVLSQFNPPAARQFDLEPGQPHRTLGPFAHLGVELPNRSDVDAVAERARDMGCLAWEPQQLAEHIGYICAARDPDGNIVEFSWNQKVYARIQELWGGRA
jgi:catechol 2,3-dioxygenase-like lactoylglutathione lyase family enzyme